MKGDYHVIIKDGIVVGGGQGAPSQLQSGETLELHDEATYQERISGWIGQRDAKESIASSKGEDRSQAFALKTMCARLFLASVDESDIDPMDPACIDPDLYTELYDEYWSTFDKTSMTPHELARAIATRAQGVSLREAERRRNILENEVYLNGQ